MPSSCAWKLSPRQSLEFPRLVGATDTSVQSKCPPQLRSCCRWAPREIQWITLGSAIQVHQILTVFRHRSDRHLLRRRVCVHPLVHSSPKAGLKERRSSEVLALPSVSTRLLQVWRLVPRLHLNTVPGPQDLLALAASSAPPFSRLAATVETIWSTLRVRTVEPVPRCSMELFWLPPPSQVRVLNP